MATTTTVTPNFNNTVTAEVKRRVLDNLRSRLAHASPENGFIPGSYQKGTNSFVYVTYADLSLATTALTEGTAPTDAELSISTESFSATQLGKTVAISDLAALQSPHNLVEIASERLARNAAETMDYLVREILVTGTSVVYSNGVARSAVSATITGALVKRMVEELQANDVEPFDNGQYRAILHPRVAADLQRDTANGGWMDIFKYTNGDGGVLTRLRTASYAGVDFVITSDARVFATAGAGSKNVYASLFFGPAAYALNDLQTLRAYFVGFGGDHSDPIAQKAILGWKMAFGCKLITGPGERIWRLESTTSNG